MTGRRSTGDDRDERLEGDLHAWFRRRSVPPTPASLLGFLDRPGVERPRVERPRLERVRRAARPPRGSARRTVRLLALAAALSLLAVASGLLVLSGQRPTAVTTPAPTSPAPVAALTPTPSASSTPSTSPTPSSPDPSGPLDDLRMPDFTTPPATAASVAWRGLDWSVIPDSNASLGLVRGVLAWRGGFLAIGSTFIGAKGLINPIWISGDSRTWQSLPPSALGNAPFIVDIAAHDSTLVAVTMAASNSGCSAGPATLECYEPGPPMTIWTSTDARTWTPRAVPSIPFDYGETVSLTAGPTGFVLAVRVRDIVNSTRLAWSPDGASWQLLRASAVPGPIAISDIAANARGYVAVGAGTTSPEHEAAVALWSTDGQEWMITGTLPETAMAGGIVEADTGGSWRADAIVAADQGFIATGGAEASPGGTDWWQSSDGRHWRFLPHFPPLGPTTCVGEGCGGQPDGSLGGDGTRMVAVRGFPMWREPSTKAAAWGSFDGLAWQTLEMHGPTPLPGEVVVLPMGVLVTSPTDAGQTVSWFGEPETAQP